VVHHQYPGVHWAKNPDRFAKHFNKGEYTKNFATAFRGTHVYEIFFLILFRQYGILADKVFFQLFFFWLTNPLKTKQRSVGRLFRDADQASN
jgi:hypothetical protein